MKGKKTTRTKAEAAPRPKHATISVGQRLHVHVTKGGREVAEYIAGADSSGVVKMNEAPEADAPVADPDPNSGT